MKRIITAALAVAVLLVCPVMYALAAAGDPLPPVEDAAAQMSDTAVAQMDAVENAAPSGEASSDEPALPPVPGVYESEDGSVLTVKEDGTATYETEVSGTVNGNAMSGRLTFHGTLEDGVFSFTKVTFFGLDLTKIAADAGYADASLWEGEAAELYAAALAEASAEAATGEPAKTEDE